MARPKCGFKKLRIVRAASTGIAKEYKHAVWDGRDPRFPRKGELYMSGAEGFECAYESPADNDHSRYFIAAPVGVSHG